MCKFTKGDVDDSLCRYCSFPCNSRYMPDARVLYFICSLVSVHSLRFIDISAMHVNAVRVPMERG